MGRSRASGAASSSKTKAKFCCLCKSCSEDDNPIREEFRAKDKAGFDPWKGKRPWRGRNAVTEVVEIDGREVQLTVFYAQGNICNLCFNVFNLLGLDTEHDSWSAFAEWVAAAPAENRIEKFSAGLEKYVMKVNMGEGGTNDTTLAVKASFTSVTAKKETGRKLEVPMDFWLLATYISEIGTPPPEKITKEEHPVTGEMVDGVWVEATPGKLKGSVFTKQGVETGQTIDDGNMQLSADQFAKKHGALAKTMVQNPAQRAVSRQELLAAIRFKEQAKAKEEERAKRRADGEAEGCPASSDDDEDTQTESSDDDDEEAGASTHAGCLAAAGILPMTAAPKANAKAAVGPSAGSAGRSAGAGGSASRGQQPALPRANGQAAQAQSQMTPRKPRGASPEPRSIGKAARGRPPADPAKRTLREVAVISAKGQEEKSLVAQEVTQATNSVGKVVEQFGTSALDQYGVVQKEASSKKYKALQTDVAAALGIVKKAQAKSKASATKLGVNMEADLAALTAASDKCAAIAEVTKQILLERPRLKHVAVALTAAAHLQITIPAEAVLLQVQCEVNEAVAFQKYEDIHAIFMTDRMHFQRLEASGVPNPEGVLAHHCLVQLESLLVRLCRAINPADIANRGRHTTRVLELLDGVAVADKMAGHAVLLPQVNVLRAFIRASTTSLVDLDAAMKQMSELQKDTTANFAMMHMLGPAGSLKLLSEHATASRQAKEEADSTHAELNQDVAFVEGLSPTDAFADPASLDGLRQVHKRVGKYRKTPKVSPDAVGDLARLVTDKTSSLLASAVNKNLAAATAATREAVAKENPTVNLNQAKAAVIQELSSKFDFTEGLQPFASWAHLQESLDCWAHLCRVTPKMVAETALVGRLMGDQWVPSSMDEGTFADIARIDISAWVSKFGVADGVAKEYETAFLQPFEDLVRHASEQHWLEEVACLFLSGCRAVLAPNNLPKGVVAATADLHHAVMKLNACGKAPDVSAVQQVLGQQDLLAKLREGGGLSGSETSKIGSLITALETCSLNCDFEVIGECVAAMKDKLADANAGKIQQHTQKLDELSEAAKVAMSAFPPAADDEEGFLAACGSAESGVVALTKVHIQRLTKALSAARRAQMFEPQGDLKKKCTDAVGAAELQLKLAQGIVGVFALLESVREAEAAGGGDAGDVKECLASFGEEGLDCPASINSRAVTLINNEKANQRKLKKEERKKREREGQDADGVAAADAEAPPPPTKRRKQKGGT